MESYTFDDHRFEALEIFSNTKVSEIESVKIIGECVQNETRDLDKLKKTFVHLHYTLGLSFFKGNY
jgi:hypothetical protein